MSGTVFIHGGPQSDAQSPHAHELERSKARSFAARISHAERRRKRLNIYPRGTHHDRHRSLMSGAQFLDCSCDLIDGQSNTCLLEHQQRYCPWHYPYNQAEDYSSVYQAIVMMPVPRELWRRPEERIAFQHWQSVTAPWTSNFHWSPRARFWDIVVPQLAQEFAPVRYLLVAFELIDLPAFFITETVASRCEKVIGYYNTAIQMLQKNPWPKVCILVCCLLAYALELRWANIDNANMHLLSSQKLVKDFKSYQANTSLMFTEAIDDTIQCGTHFMRFHTRWHLLKDSIGWKAPAYGIDTMPEVLHTSKNLVDYLEEFELFVDDLTAYMPSSLHLFNIPEAIRRIGSWDDGIHQLCQLGKIKPTVTTALFMLLYARIFLIPLTRNGVLNIYPDCLVLDYILRVFQNQLLRPLGPDERSDMEQVIRLGLKTILRFPHEPRHAVEVESTTWLLRAGNTSLA